MPILFLGLLDAANRIYHTEGMSGLYRGFWVSSAQVLSGAAYIGAYEQTRHMTAPYLQELPEIRSMVAGGVASVFGQTIIVPFDVVSQHLMMLGLSTNSTDKNKIVSLFYILQLISLKSIFYVITPRVVKKYT